MNRAPERDVDPIAHYRLGLELGRWRRLGRTPKLWWRDDDARSWTPTLDRLFDLADGRPLALAIIPSGDLHALAACLRRAGNVTVCQHGVDHVNRREPGERPCEYLRGASVGAICAAIRSAREQMRRAGLAPVFYAPPWNQADDDLIAALDRVGYGVFSAAPEAPADSGPACIGAQIDILRWTSGPPRFRGSAGVLDALRRQLRDRRRSGRLAAPIGLLTHHLDHDANAWGFLDWFLPFADQYFEWCAFADLVEVAPPIRGRAAYA
jgi:hypothetical protein